MNPADVKLAVITGKQAMGGCKPWLMENKHCVGLNQGQWKTSIVWVKRRSHVGHMGVSRLNKVYTFDSISIPADCFDSRQLLRVCELFPTALLLYTSVTVKEW